MLFIAIQVSEESAEAWVDEFTTSGPDFQQAKAAVEVRRESVTTQTLCPKLKPLCINRGSEKVSAHCVLESGLHTPHSNGGLNVEIV